MKDIQEKLQRLLDELKEEERREEAAQRKLDSSRIVHSIRITKTTIRYRPGRVRHK